jgi:hypothetical protein
MLYAEVAIVIAEIGSIISSPQFERTQPLYLDFLNP